MEKYIYESHMGSLYVMDWALDFEDLYCETCGDSDLFLGTASSREEAWELLKEDTDISGSGGYDYDYIKEFIEANWEPEETE